MNSNLPTECLLQIFENFGPTNNNWDDSFKLLHACILVNRKWCEAGITILWREPIEWLHSKEHNRNRLVPLISSYISCLPQDSKFQILNSGLQLPVSPFSLVAIDYPSLLKGFDYQSLYNAIDFWVNANYKPDYEIYQDDVIFHQFQLMELICRLLMNRCKNLKRFSIFMKAGNKGMKVDILQLPLLPGAKECFSNITEFSCKGCLFPEFMYLAAQTCRNIKRFNIECCCKDNEGLAKLIELQKVPLDCILINFKGNQIPLLESAIRKKSHSITNVRLFGYEMVLDYFRECKNIERMRLKISSPMLSDVAKNFMNSSFPKLKELFISMNTLSQSSVLIKNTHGSLESLTINSIYLNETELPAFTETLINSCKNLYHYDGPFHIERIETLQSFFQNCPKLECLILRKINGDNLDISDALQRSGPFVPINLTMLQVTNYTISSEALEIFLRACVTRLYRVLEFIYKPTSQQVKLTMEKFADQKDIKAIFENKF
ncbi:3295_t:CDS:1 [Funneliformis geosporum]|uniref:1571_t:CDS:1 n=1 Tax=Funneliformis geosporum TaxID=1117311 RepID=A0A9W4SHF3_9GLOM|nr:3295_t:CDS:1 [Funneliformis geosporum]CAI2168650.1 1571_t:CDS:1 [Funneliformis geosporum]